MSLQTNNSIYLSNRTSSVEHIYTNWCPDLPSNLIDFFHRFKFSPFLTGKTKIERVRMRTGTDYVHLQHCPPSLRKITSSDSKNAHNFITNELTVLRTNEHKQPLKIQISQRKPNQGLVLRWRCKWWCVSQASFWLTLWRIAPVGLNLVTLKWWCVSQASFWLTLWRIAPVGRNLVTLKWLCVSQASFWLTLWRIAPVGRNLATYN